MLWPGGLGRRRDGQQRPLAISCLRLVRFGRLLVNGGHDTVDTADSRTIEFMTFSG